MKKIHHSPVEVAVSMKRRRIQSKNNNYNSTTNTKTNTNTNKQNHGNHNYHASVSSSISCWMDYESIEAIEYIPSINNCHRNSYNECDTKSISQSSIICPSIASSTTTEIFMNRLQKEIILPFQFTLSSQIQLNNNDDDNNQTDTIHDAKYRRRIIQKRIIFGYNDVSKLLFNYINTSSSSNTDMKDIITKPSLIVLVNEDACYYDDSINSHQRYMNASMVQHIPTLAYEMNVPLLLLPNSYTICDHKQQRTIRTSQQLASIFCNNNTHGPIKYISIMAFTHHNTSGSLNNSIEQRINNAIDSFVDFIHGKL
jgi:hypothetical protein